MKLQKKRIEALEQRQARRREIKDCTCYQDARFHTLEEARAGFEKPCSTHGRPRFRSCFIDLNIDRPLAPADRHLCHCPPMLARQAAEEGRELSNEEQQLAKVQYHEWWQEQYRSLMGAAGAQSASG